ncbi:MAG: helix-turn-helix domain-containing protein [Candidatus Dormibacteria bacterium]
MLASDRRVGEIRLDPSRVTFELSRRGITSTQLAQLAGISESTMSTARNGHPVREGTVRRIARALMQVPILEGADAILAAPASASAIEAVDG